MLPEARGSEEVIGSYPIGKVLIGFACPACDAEMITLRESIGEFMSCRECAHPFRVPFEQKTKREDPLSASQKDDQAGAAA